MDVALATAGGDICGSPQLLGIERIPGRQFTYLTTRLGAAVWGQLRVVAEASLFIGSGRKTDWLVSWRVAARAVSWVVADDLDAMWWSSVLTPSSNEYAGDVFINILLHSAGAPLPRDIHQLYALRRLYFEYGVERLLPTGMLEFIDGLGANTRDMYVRIGEVDDLRRASLDSYRSYSFADATEIMELAMSRLGDLGDDALDLKNGALFWIYLTQWGTATLLVTGFLVWGLMVTRCRNGGGGNRPQASIRQG